MNPLHPHIDHGSFEGIRLAASRAWVSRVQHTLLISLVLLLVFTTAGFTLHALQTAETSYQQAARV